MLGSCYYAGLGLTKDYNEAVKLYKKAFELGDINAESMLGLCYYLGHGVTKNTQEGIRLFRDAAKKGNEPAKDALKKYNISE